MSLGCAPSTAKCDKDRCYERRAENEDGGAHERRFECYCSGEGCNPAAVAAPLALLLLGPLALALP